MPTSKRVPCANNLAQSGTSSPLITTKVLQFDIGFAVVAKRRGNWCMRSFHVSETSAATTLRMTVDSDPLQVIPAKVIFAENGNVRLWSSNMSR